MSLSLLNSARMETTHADAAGQEASGEQRGVAREMSERLATYRTLFMKRFHEINEMTAREVMGAVTSISGAVEGASAHIVRIRDVLGKLESGHGRLGIAEAIAQQATTLKVFLTGVSEGISRQEAVAQRAQEHLRHIAKASRDTTQLASSAKLLAVNARIEAARVGGNGNCFSTIASEMQHLAEHISQTNELIDGLAAQLTRDLPEVAVSAQALRGLCDKLSDDLSVSGTQVNTQVGNLRTVIHDALGGGDAELEGILLCSQRALSHLQFQDVVAQGLGRLEGGYVELQLFHRDAHGFDDIIAGPEHHEMGGEKDVDQKNAGEVLLF